MCWRSCGGLTNHILYRFIEGQTYFSTACVAMIKIKILKLSNLRHSPQVGESIPKPTRWPLYIYIYISRSSTNMVQWRIHENQTFVEYFCTKSCHDTTWPTHNMATSIHFVPSIFTKCWPFSESRCLHQVRLPFTGHLHQTLATIWGKEFSKNDIYTYIHTYHYVR